jgi:hypothetical protein
LVTLRGLTGVRAWITCQPYVVLTGFASSCALSAKATLSNSGTWRPFEIVSLPPESFELGSVEYFLASAAKFAPLVSCW